MEKPFIAALAGALLALGCSSPEPVLQLELHLCWGDSTIEPCAKELPNEEFGGDAAQGATCGEQDLEAAPAAFRVADRVALALGVKQAGLDSSTKLRLTATGALSLVNDAGALSSTLDIDVPSRPDVAAIRVAEASSVGPARVELSGLGQSQVLTADVTRPLLLGFQKPKFKRLQKLASQFEIGVCSTLASGDVALQVAPPGGAPMVVTLSPAAEGVCPTGYRGFGTFIWTGNDSSIDLVATQRSRSQRCTMALPTAVAAVDVELLSEPLWQDISGKVTSIVEMKITGTSTDGTKTAVLGVTPAVAGANAEIQAITATDKDGAFSFAVTTPKGPPLPISVLVEGRFRKIVTITRPAL
jgi:hypothetical protein